VWFPWSNCPLAVLVNDDLASYTNIYKVTATITYLDVTDVAAEQVTLYDPDNNRSFTNTWTPKAPGRAQLNMTVTSIDGQAHSATTMITVKALADFVVQRVEQKRVPILTHDDRGYAKLDEPLAVWATIRNTGAPVQGSVAVEFRYYRAETPAQWLYKSPRPNALPFRVVRKSFTPSSGWFAPNTDYEIVDTSIDIPATDVYYVEVIVDPVPLPVNDDPIAA
jgi:hypothetical protein